VEIKSKDSGRMFEHFLEHEHLLGNRIFACGALIAERLGTLGAVQSMPQDLHAAIGMLVYLTDNFVDQAHFHAEDAVAPLAVARGMDPRHNDWVYAQHDQARAYFKAIHVAWQRIQAGDPYDVPYAIDDLRRCIEGFVKLLTHHGERENDEWFPEMGSYLSADDDDLITKILEGIGPRDLAPYVHLVGSMEQTLGIPSPA
jgi:hemerythrin-like domain-containing protein